MGQDLNIIVKCEKAKSVGFCILLVLGFWMGEMCSKGRVCVAKELDKTIGQSLQSNAIKVMFGVDSNLAEYRHRV